MAFTSFETAIKTYLDGVAEKDELFAKSYKKPNKSIKECCAFLMGEAKKAAVNGSIACKDEEIYGLAMHYYDEDDIKADEVPAKANVVHVPGAGGTAAPKATKGRCKRGASHTDADNSYELEIPIF